MAGLAPGGHSPVLTLSMMGISALIIGSIINPLAGLVPLFGMGCLMAAVFMGYFWRDPDRPIPRTPGVLVSPCRRSCHVSSKRASHGPTPEQAGDGERALSVRPVNRRLVP